MKKEKEMINNFLKVKKLIFIYILSSVSSDNLIAKMGKKFVIDIQEQKFWKHHDMNPTDWQVFFLKSFLMDISRFYWLNAH